MMKLRIGYLISGITTGFIVLLSFIWSQPDGKLHIVFCNVGQGDAAYVRFADGRDMLIDGGPNTAGVLSCLGRHMPFWDRNIDIVALSHPQKDHMEGLSSVFERYSVGYFIRSNVDSTSEGFVKLMGVVKKKNMNVKYVTTGDLISIGSTSLSVLWPSKEQLATRVTQAALATQESQNVLGTTDTQLNDFSLVIVLKYGTFDVLLPGDADSHVEAKYSQLQASIDPIEILKVPHHGSKTGMTRSFVEWVRPALSVISVGKNSYGHPSIEAVNMLQNVSSRVLRTDRDGDIEIISDGKSWQVIDK
jgi:competence protein ComEC